MGLLQFLFGASPAKRPKSAAKPSQEKHPAVVLSSDDDGAFVDGRPTFYYAEHAKDDLALMLRCCDAELEAMERTNLAPAPFYFERAAILYRRTPDYVAEIAICQRYFDALEGFYAKRRGEQHGDARTGQTYVAMEKRCKQAKELAAKTPTNNPAR
jgi:hypothetical protein